MQYQLEVDLAGNITQNLPWGPNDLQAGMTQFSGDPTNPSLPQSLVLIPLGSSPSQAAWIASVEFYRANPPPGEYRL